ncbi:uncharacterized protein [Medicago truncatula]|uniref:uncharacterized protein n=1 Tax=Medicago truncatula TaxID=3880 RepID=UPI0019680020|nr:uncharacterized protein LOC11422905 [Medicago truncatula]
MGKKESNPFGRPYNFSAPQDQTPNKPMIPHWDTTMQENNALLQCDPTDLSYNPHVAEDAALAFSEMVHKRNPDFNKLFARNSEPVLSLMTGESREYANQSSASKHDRDGTSRREASGSKRSTDGDQDDSNKDSPSSMKQRSNIIIGDENPSGLAQNLVTVVKESDTDIDVDAQLKNMVL